MVSEAKKPLLGSMAFLALYSTIIIGITTFMVISEIKGKSEINPELKPGVGPLDSPSGPINEEKEPPKSKKNTFKKVAELISKFTSQGAPKNYLKSFLALEGDHFLEPSPAELLERFQQEFYLKVATEAPPEVLEETVVLREFKGHGAAEEEASPCKLFELQNTFRLPHSPGLFGFYNTTGAFDRESVFNLENLKVFMDDYMDISDRKCHIKVVLATDCPFENTNTITEDNVRVLAEHLINIETPWEPLSLQRLAFPNVFGLFIGFEPVRKPAEVDLKHERLIEITKKQMLFIDNIFNDETRTAIFYGNLSLEGIDRGIFGSLQDYALHMKLNQFYHMDNVKIFHPHGYHITIHFAANDNTSLKTLLLNHHVFVEALLRNGLSNRRKPEIISQLRDKRFCILFVFEKSDELNVESIATWDDRYGKQEETQLLAPEIVKSPYFFGPSSYASVKKYTNYDNLRGQVAYEFICQVGAQSPNGKLEEVRSDERYDMFYTRTNGSFNFAALIGTNFYDNVILRSEGEMGRKWATYCSKFPSSSSFKILIVIK